MRRFAFLLLLCGLCAAQSPTPKQPAKAAPVGWKAIHDSALVVDTHADTPQPWLDKNINAADPDSKLMVTIPAAKAGNLGAEFFSIWVDPVKFKGHYPDRTLALIDAVYQQVQRNPKDMMFATSVKDIYAARREHKLASLMGIEGGHSIANDLGLLRDYYRLGVRYMTLTWSNTNDWADSSGDVDDKNIQHHDGLTDFGRDVVREMNRIGMIVDISHTSDRTFYKTLVVARAPVIASHSSSRALTNVPRNMTDDMLRALNRNGGVAMVNFNCGFISNEYAAAEKKLEAEDHSIADLKKKAAEPGSNITEADIQKAEDAFYASIPRPPLSNLIDHIDHMVKIAGIDHVGLGSDFDGVSCTPEGIDSAADLPKITQALHDRGYNAEQIKKILGGNILHVFSEVEKTAAQLQAESPENKDTRHEVKLDAQPKK
ncbi:Membrane dipeptidase [Candidatus Koribacter versatilis Ellin345]|uniref:Membrane dipeptidase n=1 Tax=Koribacter versatilis (strain Ellin345) TaxID=204669 RepID=Q1INH0_KORVE|nr:dipeptidase [Candidatus Koribacter versatilis]ABF41580.1 Membrane dipeptidase [Candidatus Koribacter versatilis Ellin345]